MTPKPIQIHVQGVIIQQNQILLVKMNDASGLYFTLPGTTVRQGESLTKSLKRGIHDMLGTEVEAAQMLLISEHIPERKSLTMVFIIHLDSSRIAPPRPTDANQINVVWMPLNALEELPMKPAIASQLKNAIDQKKTAGSILIETVKTS